MKSFILTVAMSCSFLFAMAQIEVGIDESTKLMSQGEEPVFIVSVDGADAQMMERVWKDYIKQFKGKKNKKDKKTNEFFSDNATISSLSSNTVDVYASFINNGDIGQTAVWVDLGGTYLSTATNPDLMEATSEFLNNYGLSVGKYLAEEQVKEEEDLLKSMGKELDKMAKEKEKYEAEIEKAKALIEEMERNIEQNMQEQESKQGEIDDQEGILKDAEKHLKSFKDKY